MNSLPELYHTRNTSSNTERLWQELQKKNELAYCSECGTKIWKYWKLPPPENRLKIGEPDVSKKKVYSEMTKCAPCLFNHE